jgi:hypothetical protein
MDNTGHIDGLIDSLTAILGIPVAPEWRAGIRSHLEMSLRLADIVGEFALPDEAEPAPTFHP